MAERALSHDELAADLATHLRGYSTPMCVWLDMQLGPSGSARPDVYTIEKTYAALRARVFEAKISRADFLADVTAGKYLRYYEFAGSITFATPAGLISRDEVPSGCGLITRSADGVWRYQKKPTLQAIKGLPQQAWLKLVIDGVERELGVHTLREGLKPRQHSEWLHAERARKLAGEEVALAIRNRDAAKRDLEQEAAGYRSSEQKLLEARRQGLAEERRQLDEAVEDAAKQLGLKLGCGVHAVIHELRGRLGTADIDRITQAARTLNFIQKHTSQAIEELQRLLPPAPEEVPSPT